MGWIRDLHEEGFDALAERMRGSSRWPAGHEVSVRGLGNQLRKLDRGEDLQHWRRKGAALVPALADALNLSLLDVEEHLDLGGEAPLPFPEFPGLRAFEVDLDSPPPGIPPELVDPAARWYRDGARRLWWTTQGTERLLLRNWSCRKLGFTTLRARRWEDALERMPAQGRVWVELSEAGGRSPEDTPLSEALRIVVAAPFPLRPLASDGHLYSRRFRHPLQKDIHSLPNIFDPSTSRIRPEERLNDGGHEDYTRWAEVRSASPALWTPELLDWVEARLPRSSTFRPNAEALLKQDWLAPRLRTPGQVLEILGLLHQGARVDPDSLLSNWVKSRIDRAELDPSIAGWLLRHGPRILLRATGQRLERGWSAEASVDQWEILLEDPEYIANPRQALALLDHNRVDDARRVLRRPPQGALLPALRLAEILVPRGDQRLGLSTEWVGPLLVQKACLQSLALPNSWGPLLLGDEASPLVVRQLYRRALEGDLGFADQAIISLDANHVETVAAVEGACLVVGLVAARRNVDPGLALRLLEAVKSVRSDWSGRMLPLVHGDRRVAELSIHAGRIADALLAIAAGKRIGPGRSASVLSQVDWLEGASAADAIDIWEAVWILGARIEESWQKGELPPVTAPARLLRLLAENASGPELTALLALPFPLRALKVTAAEKQLDLPPLLERAWEFWATDPSSPPFSWLTVPAPRSVFSPTTSRLDEALELWRHLPPTMIEGPFAARLASVVPTVAKALSSAVWERWWAGWCAAPTWLPPDVLRNLPEALLRDALPRLPVLAVSSRENLDGVIDVLWEKWQLPVLDYLEAALPQPVAPWLSLPYWLVLEAPWSQAEPRIAHWLQRASPTARIPLGERIQRAVSEKGMDPRLAWPLLRECSRVA